MLNITIGLDDEAASAGAVDWVIRRFRDRRARVTLVTAYDVETVEPFVDTEVLDREADRVRAGIPGAVVRVALSEGSASRVLEEHSRRSDLVVVGAHRSRRLRSLLTGRLPLDVAEHAGCPVVVVPDDARYTEAGEIVVGLAGDASSDAAVDFAVDEAAEAGAVVRLVHAWSRPVPVDDLAVPALLVDETALRSEHGMLLARTARRLRSHGLVVREHLHEGSHVRAITGLAGAALIVIGSHRGGGFGPLLEGSTLEQLLRSSRVPVCVVPPRAPWLDDATPVPELATV